MTEGSVQDQGRSRLLEELAHAGDSPWLLAFPQGAVFAFDRDLRYLAAGGSGLADVGWSREMLEGRTIFEAFPPETASVIEPLYRAALRGETSTIDVPFQGRIYTQRLVPVTDSSGLAIAGLGFTQDVTDVRRAEQALRESEQRLRLSFENAPIGKAIVELDGRWRAVNPALTKLMGFPEAQLLTMSFQDITHPDDLELDLDLLHRLVANQIPSYQMEKRYITAAGETVRALLSVSLVRDEEGQPLYFISQILDLTEQKRQQQALSDLTAMLAHDLRTPTTVISGFAEMMLDGWETHTDEARRAAFQRVASAARSMRHLLENSLAASALDTNGLRATPTLVDLYDVVREALDFVPHQDHRIDLSAVAAAEAWFDRSQLLQVLTNLLTNAVKYGGERIAMSVTQGSDRLLLTVSDNGTGVPAGFVPVLFDRYTRSEAVRAGRHRGSGLGLHIVRDLLRLNGGAITYSDTPGGGATFTLDLPRPLADLK